MPDVDRVVEDVIPLIGRRLHLRAESENIDIRALAGRSARPGHQQRRLDGAVEVQDIDAVYFGEAVRIGHRQVVAASAQAGDAISGAARAPQQAVRECASGDVRLGIAEVVGSAQHVAFVEADLEPDRKNGVGVGDAAHELIRRECLRGDTRQHQPGAGVIGLEGDGVRVARIRIDEQADDVAVERRHEHRAGHPPDIVGAADEGRHLIVGVHRLLPLDVDHRGDDHVALVGRRGDRPGRMVRAVGGILGAEPSGQRQQQAEAEGDGQVNIFHGCLLLLFCKICFKAKIGRRQPGGCRL